MEGMEKILARLNSISYDIAANLESAAKAGTRVIRDRAKDNVPVRTGTLRNSIIIETAEKDEDGVVVRIGPKKDAFYGMFLELGTSKMAARPWLWPAVQEKKEEALKVVEDKLRRIVNNLSS